jgi:hypothetical protein
VPFGSFPIIPGAEFAEWDFFHAKTPGVLVLILSFRGRRSAD